MYFDNSLLTPLVGHYGLIIHCLFIFSIAGIFHWIQHQICKRLHSYFTKTINIWDDTLIYALSVPLSFGIWVYAIALAVGYTLIGVNHTESMDEMERTRIVCFILVLIWFFWRFTNLIELRLAQLAHLKRKVDVDTIATIGRFIRIGLGIIVLLIILSSIGVPLSGVIAFGGGGALIIGVAAQPILANWFSGLMIFLDKPFKPNEWISSPDRNLEGKVVDIGWRTTKIIGPDNCPRYIPNSIFSQVIIANSQRITHRKIEATISLRYEDIYTIRDIVNSIDKMLRSCPAVNTNERYMVHFVGFENATLNIHFLCSVNELNFNKWRDIQQDIFLKIIDIIIENNAKLAYSAFMNQAPEHLSLPRTNKNNK